MHYSSQFVTQWLAGVGAVWTIEDIRPVDAISAEPISIMAPKRRKANTSDNEDDTSAASSITPSNSVSRVGSEPPVKKTKTTKATNEEKEEQFQKKFSTDGKTNEQVLGE